MFRDISFWKTKLTATPTIQFPALYYFLFGFGRKGIISFRPFGIFGSHSHNAIGLSWSCAVRGFWDSQANVNFYRDPNSRKERVCIFFLSLILV
ncbi:unnamed protein product [Orchesella dallaii]|uniref:Uncharacterized protein n=1 Tax=Orchesella dallaii TaxID=48710 RepID=A0ABP1S3T0_9HEXA